MRRRVLLPSVTIAVAAGITGLAVLHALTAAQALESARGELAAAQETTTDAGDAAVVLAQAAEDLDVASVALQRWPVDVLAAVPVLGRSWDAERAVTLTAREVVSGATLLSQRLSALRAGGGVDLDALAALEADLRGPVRRSVHAYEQLRRTPVELMPATVSEGVVEARDALGPAVRALTQAEKAVGVTAGLLGASGPRSVLVALQNNAELRGAGGYVSSFATGRAEGGRLTLGPLQDLVAVADPPALARTVPAPEEYVEDYADVAGNSTMWRTWNMSPHVPDSALVGARVAGAVLGTEPDVVVMLDVPALGALAALGGSGVPLPDGTTVSADELTDALLVDAYAAAGSDAQAQRRRREQLQAAASAAMGRLLSGNAPSSELAATMAELTAQRHLSVWSARADEQQALVDLGAAGALVTPIGGDLSHVSVNNVGANKLDTYVDRDLAVDVVVGQRSASVTQRIRFTNTAPAGLVPYVAGSDQPGVVTSRVELSVPPTAQDLTAEVDGGPWIGELHTGGGRQRLLTRLELDRGASAELEVRYTLPIEGGEYRLRLVPQPLVEDADLELTVRAAAGARLGSVSGAPFDGSDVETSQPLSTSTDVSVMLEQPERTSRWHRLQHWWNEPVRLG